MRHLFGTILISLSLMAATCPVHGAEKTVRWTVPGDDGFDCLTGDPVEYDIAWSADSSALVASDVVGGFLSGDMVEVLAGLSCGVCGSTEDHTLTGLPSGSVVYVAVKCRDDAGNTSEISNILRFETVDEIAPAAVMDLRL